MTLAFPITIFLFSDLFHMRRRLIELKTNQQETAYPGRMKDNLHRYARDLRALTFRIVAVMFVAALIVQFDYWLAIVMADDATRELIVSRASTIAVILVGFLLAALVIVAIFYLRGLESTRSTVARVGSPRDEEELSSLGVGWLIRTTMLGRMSGLICLSIPILLGHVAWSLGPGSFLPAEVVPLTEETRSSTADRGEPSWMPSGCVPAPGAQLIAIPHPILGTTQTLYTRIQLTPILGTDSVDDASLTFVLIPQLKGDWPLSFYIMEAKVSVAEFDAFEEAKPAFISASAARMRDKISVSNPEQPRLGVTGMEAIRYAEVACMGKLPTPQQFDVAWGRDYDSEAFNASVDFDIPFSFPDAEKPGRPPGHRSESLELS